MKIMTTDFALLENEGYLVRAMVTCPTTSHAMWKLDGNIYNYYHDGHLMSHSSLNSPLDPLHQNLSNPESGENEALLASIHPWFLKKSMERKECERVLTLHTPPLSTEERLWLQSGKPASHKKAMDSIGVSMAVYCSSM
ncbi:hypothetical protein V8G54_014009 [Vigna mungo]|uniref:Uncharacterized protein n=1 Tax=Vigna mungo TaxID=3915 RepID=A0AAQ3NFX0_VIGMU